MADKDTSTTIKFLYGSRDGIESKVEDGMIDGSDIVITSDTDELVFVDKNKNIKPLRSRTVRSHTIKGTNLGSLVDGEELEAGLDLDDFIDKIGTIVVPPTYVEPEVTISYEGEFEYEVGSTVTVAVSGEFVKNDAGQLSSIEILKDGVSVASSSTSPVQSNSIQLVVPDGETKFVVKATYGEGAVKEDNTGEEHSEGHIPAGHIETEPVVVTGKRCVFIGSGEDDLPEQVDSDWVRELASDLMPEDVEVYRIECPIGTKWVAFALPASAEYEPTVSYVEASDASMLSAFEKKTVSVKGADNGTAADYDVYVYGLPVPARALMNFDVEL